MRRLGQLLACTVVFIGLLAFPLVAWAGHQADPRTKNLHPMGHIFEPRVLGGAAFDPINEPDGDIHTDIAFWGKHAFQGNWDGFSIRNIAAPGNPKPVSRTFCDGNQGDVVVWDDVLVRSWNTDAGTPGPFGAGLTCDGQAVPEEFEGLHVFDISDLGDPELVASVELECGSHTATGVPDGDNGRLLIYNSSSSTDCPGLDIVEVPLDDPASASFLRFEPGMRSCHDTGVILGDAMRAACAGGDGFTVWSLGGDAGGTLEDPELLYTRSVPTVTIGHSAAFSWDGEVILFGHEPGGGVGARCQETGTQLSDDPDDVQTDEMKSYFFFDTETGNELGRWTLPRPQSATENCTLHNPNVIPLRDGRDVFVAGHYQAGTWVGEFTDPGNTRTIAWSDPPPAPVPPESPFCCDVAGAWSSYWYDGFIYESSIGEGLNVFGLSDKTKRTAMKLGHLNPQTQEFTID